MKILAILLSTYFLALNFAPCDDSNNLESEPKYEISQISDNSDCDLELCSPFCQCHCCHVHATNFNFADFNLASRYVSGQDFFHFKGLEKDFSNSILQPPRV